MVVRELITKILFKTDERGLKNAEMKTKRFAKAAKWAVAGIAVGIAAIGVASVKAAAEMESMTTQFEVMLGSAEKANALMEKLKKFSAATPFQLPDLVRGTQTLISFGVAEEDVIDRLRMLGDAALGNTEKLKGLILAYGKVQTKGKVSMEEINMIAERGVPIIGTLQKQLGVTEQQFFKLVSAGKIGRKEITQAFKTMTSEGGVFFKGMEKASQDLNGLISTLKDNLTLVAAEIGNALLPLMKSLAKTLIELVQGPLGDLIETLVGVLVPILEILTPLINMVLGAIAPLNKILEILARLIGKLLAGAMKIIAPLMELIAEVVGVIAGAYLGGHYRSMG
jgi:tape measure domain-containing protein